MNHRPPDGILTANGLTSEFRLLYQVSGMCKIETATGESYVPEAELQWNTTNENHRTRTGRTSIIARS
jgi:hypothetical protein